MRLKTLIFAACWLVSAALAVRGEDTVSTEKVLPLDDLRDAYTPCAAFVKDGYLVAWQSGRLAPGDLREGLKFNGDIVGCRVSKMGEVLSKEPFVICRADDLQERPRAAANKDLAIVVWQDLRNGKDWDVYAARISPEGKVLDPDGFMVSGEPHNQACPRVAWDGKSFVVVWQDYRRRKYEVYAARVSAEGKVLDPQGVPVSSQPVACYDPAVASTGDGRSVVVWNTVAGLGARSAIVADGKLEQELRPDNNGPAERENQRAFAGWANTPLYVAAGKDVYLMAWRNERPVGRGNGSERDNACVFDSRGPRAKNFTLAGEPHRILNADLAWDGTAFVSAWTELRSKDNRFAVPHEHVFVSRIGMDGRLLGRVQLIAGAREAGSEKWEYLASDKRRWTYSNTQLGKAFVGKPEAPAMNAAAASDGAGATLIAYEKHPDTGDVPIKIGFRMIRPSDVP